MYQSKYLPKVPNYGFVNPDFNLPIHTVVPKPIQLHDVDWLEGLMSQAAPEIAIPDIVQVHWGAGNKDIIGQLYSILADGPSQLVGVSKDTARNYLTQWGYPEDPSTQTAEWFDQQIASHALDLNPLMALGGGQ